MASWRDLRPQLLRGVTKEAVGLCAASVSVFWYGTSSSSLRRVIDLVRSHGRSHFAAGTRDVLDVALLVHRLTVFVGRKISRQIYWLAANITGYVW